MKLFFVCRGMGEGGGIQRVITEITHEITKQELVDELVIVSDNFPEDLKETETVKFVKIWTPASYLTKFPRYGLLLAAQPVFIINSSFYLKKHKQKGDVVFNHGVGETLYQDIAVFHSCHTEWVNKKRQNKRLGGYISPLDWVLQLCETLNTKKENSKKVVAVSNLTKDQVQGRFRLNDVTVIPNGVNVERFVKVSNKNKAREKWNIAADDFVVLFVANEWKRKGLLTLGKAIDLAKEDIPGLKLMMAGRNLEGGYEELLSRYDLKDRIIFPGPVSDIQEVYHASDVFCLPSEEDAFGLVIAEAMSSGIPAIITDQCGIKEYISNGEDGYILPYSSNMPETIKTILADLYHQPALKEKIGNSGQEMVQESMSWSKIARQYVAVAEETVQ